MSRLILEITHRIEFSELGTKKLPSQIFVHFFGFVLYLISKTSPDTTESTHQFLL